MKFLKTAFITTWVISFLLISQSCKKKSKIEESSEDTEIVIESKESKDESDFEGVKDCDDFLDQYEDWTEEYASFMEKYKDNPGKAYGDQEFIKMLSYATTFTTEWATIATSCAANSSYEERMEEITKNMEDKMKELGFKD